MASPDLIERSFCTILSADEVAQRVVRVTDDVSLFPEPGVPFDLWHNGIPWASRIRSEACPGPQPSQRHYEHYLEGGELHAGLRWEEGARLKFDRRADGQIELSGDVEA